METTSFSRTIPVKYKVDVCVAGGGPAGAAAAVMAARQGVSVLLIEGQGCLGGMGTSGLIPWYCGMDDGERLLCEGFFRELRTRMFALDGFGPWGKLEDDRSVMAIRAEPLKRVYDDMAVEAGVRLSFHTQVIAAEVAGKRVARLVCAAKSGLFAVEAKSFIDCTGDGDVSVMAGAAFEKGDEKGLMMATTLCSHWAGIDWEKASKAKVHEELKRAIEAGVFAIPDYHLPGIVPSGKITGGANIGHIFEIDGTNEQDLTKALLHGRKILSEYRRFYREYVAGYEQAEPIQSGSLLGVRETRRIMGDYVLNIEDYVKRSNFEDEIGRNAYWIDIHQSKAGKDSYTQFEDTAAKYPLKPGESYGIPYRCLTVKGLENLLVAGRCVSVDRPIQSSIRVMGPCYVTGQAAGLASAMAANKNGEVRAIDIKALRRQLAAMKVPMSNC